MQSTHIFSLIQALSQQEVREVRKFLQSPYFNTRLDLLQMFDFLTSNKAATKHETWALLHPGIPFDDQKHRLLVSYLYRLLEQYLSLKEFTANDLHSQLLLAQSYRKRGMAAAFERTRLSMEKTMAEQPLRDAHFHQSQYQLHWEKYHTATAENPAAQLPLADLAGAIDVFYLSTRLRLICIAVAQQSIYQAGNQSFMEKELVELAEHERWADQTAITIYLHCYRMLKQPEEESHFQAFKQLLLEASDRFGKVEMWDLYLFAINYCIRSLNAGLKRFFKEALDLYKSGLNTGHLLENGVLSRFTYHNIVAAGLQTGDLGWVDFFIHEYKNSLERSYRESSFSFSLARLEFARRRYDVVLELLQKANYRDPLLNLAAKSLLLKTWYELGELDLLQSHLDAMRNYIHRKRVIGYHRTNYLNIVRYTDKLLRLNWNSKKEVEGLKNELEKEEVLTEKEWLLGQVGG